MLNDDHERNSERAMDTKDMTRGAKVVLFGVLFVLIVIAALWAFVWVTEARQDAAALTEKLEAIPVPAELVLVDQWEHDGSFLAGGRPREAARAYVAPADVASICDRIDAFYADLGISLGAMQRSDVSDEQWCGRTLRGRDISIWVDEIKPYSLVPEEYRDRDDLVTVRYSAF